MPDVIVIGAGVVGAATAYMLDDLGVRVSVVDGGEVAAGTSAATFAVDITRAKTPRRLFDLSAASTREHAALQRRFVNRRWLHPAVSLEWGYSEQDRRRIQDRVRRLCTWGCPTQWVSVQRVRHIEPALALTDHALEVAYYPDGAWYEPAVLAPVLLESAQRQRTRVYLNDPVTAMSTSKGRITGIATAAGRRLSADVIVNCAGPKAGDVAALAGVELPLRRVPGLVATTTPARTRLRTILSGGDLNVRPQRGGRIMLHSWLLDRELGDRPEPQRPVALARRLLRRAQTLLPGLAAAEVQSASVGVRPVPLDGQPVTGFQPELGNLYTVLSHSAVHLAPILGRLVSCEIAGDPQERLDPFRPSRFQSGQQECDVLDESTSSMLSVTDAEADPTEESPDVD